MTTTQQTNFVAIGGDLSGGGVLTPLVNSDGGRTTGSDPDIVTLTSLGGIGQISNWFVDSAQGDDTVTINGNLRNSEIDLGLGADIFNINRFGLGGSLNGSNIRGNDGNDTLNLLVGGEGSANSTFRGGDGDDLVNLKGDFTNVEVAGGGDDDAILFLGSGVFTGSEARGGGGDDFIRDNGFEIVLAGSTLRGGGDDDLIDVSNSIAGIGVNGLFIGGGDGDDSLYGTRSGQNTIRAGGGADFVQAFDGDDLLVGGGGADIIVAGQGNDTVFGDDDQFPELGDADVIFGILGSNKIFAQGGDDFVAGGLADDSVDGGAGDDTLIGGSGNDTLNGGEGNDVIFGNDIGQQTAFGFNLDGTPDTIADEVRDLYTDNQDNANDLAIGNPVINVGVYNAAAGAFQFQGEFTPQPFNNFLTGGNGNDIIFGGAGVDNIAGGSGNDTIIGGAGSDVMSGGGASGNDVFVQGNGASFDADEITGGGVNNNYLFTWTDDAPDIITDFIANSGDFIVDRIAFQTGVNADDWAAEINAANTINEQSGGNFDFVDATNTPNIALAGIGNVVLFRGEWTADNGTFAANATGNDALVFVIAGQTFGTINSLGSQAVVLENAGGQAFQAGNFAFG